MTLVAIVDDHRLFAASLAFALRDRGFEVAEPVLEPPEQLAARVAALGPDVVLLDLDLASAGNGDGLVAPLAAGGAAVLVVSALGDEVRIGRCLGLGAAGWVAKSAPLEELLAAVPAAAAKRSVQTSRERARLIEAWRRARPAGALSEGLERLTPREGHVLGQLVRGRTVRTIAETSFVSPATVRSQVRSILEKLNVSSQLQAVAVANQCGWVGPLCDPGREPDPGLLHRPS